MATPDLPRFLFAGTEILGAAFSGFAVILVLWGKAPPPFLRTATKVGLIFLVVRTLLVLTIPGETGTDYDIFRRAGQRSLAGGNPYQTDPVRWAPLNPPTALPVMRLFALMPRRLGLTLWTLTDLACSLSLIPLAWAALRGAADWPGDLPALTEAERGLLSIAVASSYASALGRDVGQFSNVAAALILLALVARAGGRPITAGVSLGLATAKVGTMIPFLILFLSRRDWPVWAALAAAIVLLCALSGDVRGLPGRVQHCLEAIRYQSEPGRINDFSYYNEHSQTIVSLERWLWGVGVRDRGLAALVQLSLLLLLGCWMAWLAVRPAGFPRPTLVAMVALYSAIFLYHRTYDMVILALPLVYTLARLRQPAGSSRAMLVAVLLGLVVVLDTPTKPFWRFMPMLKGGQTWARLGQAFLLPYATWIVVAGIAALWWTAPARPASAPSPAAE